MSPGGGAGGDMSGMFAGSWKVGVKQNKRQVDTSLHRFKMSPCSAAGKRGHSKLSMVGIRAELATETGFLRSQRCVSPFLHCLLLYLACLLHCLFNTCGAAFL